MVLAARRAPLVALSLALVAAACGGRSPEDDLRPARRPASAAPPSAEALAALPYARWVAKRPADGSGVTLHRRGRAAPGLNLYSTSSFPGASLFDLDGEVVHRWHAPPGRQGWRLVEPFADGGLLVLELESRINRVDWRSREIWTVEARVHHDIEVTADGRILVPIWVPRPVGAGRGLHLVLDPQLLVLSPDGEELGRRSLWEELAADVPPERIREARQWTRRQLRRGIELAALDPKMDTPPDLLHLNSVEEIDRDLPGIARRGDLLVCLREIDTVAILDPELTTVRWKWGPGELERPHHPSLLDDGRILIFDNGVRRRSSRVLEVDPTTREIVWQYPTAGAPPFFTLARGGVQRLPNGNSLITVSADGRVLEVTREGESVWEYFTPEERVDAQRGLQRPGLYRLRRLPPAEVRGLGIDRRLREARRAERFDAEATAGG